MGAVFNSRVFPDAPKAQITEKWNDMVEASREERGTKYSGDIGMLKGRIDWQEHVTLPSEKAADDHISSLHEKWAPAMAVRFKDEKTGAIHWMIGGWCSE